MHSTNSLSPERMTQDQRLQEIAYIMATGLIRLRTLAQDLPSDHDVSLAMFVLVQ